MAALIPAAIEAAPAILSGLSTARDIIGKYAPAAKRVSSMLFAAHKKSPSHLLSKIRGLKASDVVSGVKRVGKYIGSGKALSHAKMLAGDVNKLAGIVGKDTSGYTGAGVAKVADVTRSYHNVLERLR